MGLFKKKNPQDAFDPDVFTITDTILDPPRFTFLPAIYQDATHRKCGLQGLPALGRQLVKQPSGPLQPGPGQTLPLLQVQGPGEGGGAAKQVGHLRGKGVDKGEQIDPAVLPPGFPVRQCLPHHLRLSGGLLGCFVPAAVVLRQGGDLLPAL